MASSVETRAIPTNATARNAARNLFPCGLRTPDVAWTTHYCRRRGVTVDPTKSECPLFALAFRSGLAQLLHDLAEVDIEADRADFVWVHLDLGDADSQAWLKRRPWPLDVVQMVAAPIQRGRLFIAPDMIYGHLRDFRDASNAVTLEAGSLSVVASRKLL